MPDEKYQLTLTGQQIDDALLQMANRVPEGWAVGTKDGVEVPSTSEFYHNNAKYYAEQAALSAEDAEETVEEAIAELDVDELNRKILASFPHDSITNAPVASFIDGADGIPVKALTVNIAPVQAAGTPTPENPLPISGWTGATITRANKNLFNLATVTEHYYIAADGTVTPFEDAKMSDYIKVSPGKWILDSAKLPVGSAGMNRIHCYDANKGWIAQLAAVSNGLRNNVLAIPITVPEGAVYIRFSMPLSTGGYTQYLQFERGEIATDYDAYSAETCAVSWQSEAGTVCGGTLDVTTGVLTVTLGIVDLSTRSWTYNASYGYIDDNALSGVKAPATNYGVVVGGAEKYGLTSRSVITDTHHYGTNQIAVGANGKILVSSGTATPTGKFAYELASAQVIQLTPTDVLTSAGVNNIFADTGNVSVEYRADPTLFINGKVSAIMAAISEL